MATGTPLCPPIDRGSGYCGNSERHECELQLEVEDIHHRAPKPKVRKPKAFVSASHKNVLNEFNGVTLLPPLSQKRSEFKIYELPIEKLNVLPFLDRTPPPVTIGCC